MQEAIVTIKFTLSEIERLINSLNLLKTMRIPVEPEWKIPYKSLLKDLKKIKENTLLAADDYESDRNSEQFKETQLLEWKRTGQAGCKSGECD